MRIKCNGNYASSSDAVHEFDRTKKKKKKVFTAIWYYIRPEFCDLFVLRATFSSNHPDAYSQWRERWNLVRGTLKSRLGTLNLDGGDANSRRGNASPYNLSTDCCRCIAYLSSCHRTTSGTITIGRSAHFSFIDYFVLREIRNCLKVSCDR